MPQLADDAAAVHRLDRLLAQKGIDGGFEEGVPPEPVAEASTAQRPADDSASGAAEQLAQANRQYNQALVATESGDFAAASDLYSQALAIREAVYGRESNVAAQTLFAMGSASLLAERPSAAAAHYRSAAAAYGAALGRGHRKAVDALARAERCDAQS